VPVIVRGPGFDPGRVVDDPVGTIDLAPTALSCAGIEIPDDMEGRPLLDGPREHVLTENDHQMVFDHSLRTLCTRQYKVTRHEAEPNIGELYDLENDPLELVNLWDDPSCTTLRSDLLATLDDVMNHDIRKEPVVGVVA
jgi:uncharacterized sulfatase